MACATGHGALSAHRKLSALCFLALFFFHACWAAAAGPTPPSQAETLQLLQQSQFDALDQRFSAIQSAYRASALSDEDLRAAFRVFYATDTQLAPKYDAWVKRSPKSYVANLARGIYFKRLAGERRGNEFASKTTSEQFRGMNVALGEAQVSLEASMKLDAKPLLSYVHAIDISRNRGDYRKSRELFERSLAIEPRTFIVREKFMDTLRPRWGGSLQQMSDLLEQSRKAGVSPAGMRKLQAMVADERAYQMQYVARNYPEAIKSYREAESLGGDFCVPCFGQALTHEKQYADAVKTFDRALIANPRDADSLGRRGNAYMSLNKPIEGIADFKAAAAMGDGYAQSQLGCFSVQGIPGVLDADPQAGVEWIRKSAAQGNEVGKALLEEGGGVSARSPAG